MIRRGTAPGMAQECLARKLQRHAVSVPGRGCPGIQPSDRHSHLPSKTTAAIHPRKHGWKVLLSQVLYAKSHRETRKPCPGSPDSMCSMCLSTGSGPGCSWGTAEGRNRHRQAPSAAPPARSGNRGQASPRHRTSLAREQLARQRCQRRVQLDKREWQRLFCEADWLMASRPCACPLSSHLPSPSSHKALAFSQVATDGLPTGAKRTSVGDDSRHSSSHTTEKKTRSTFRPRPSDAHFPH